MTLTARQVRNHNRRTIYKLLLRMGRTTKTELAALSGLEAPRRAEGRSGRFGAELLAEDCGEA